MGWRWSLCTSCAEVFSTGLSIQRSYWECYRKCFNHSNLQHFDRRSLSHKHLSRRIWLCNLKRKRKKTIHSPPIQYIKVHLLTRDIPQSAVSFVVAATLSRSLAQMKDVLSVLPLVFFALAHAVCGVVWGESGGVAAALQMVEQLVSRGELVVTGHAAEV